MHSERPPKHHILHIFNAFIIFYYPSLLSSPLPHRLWPHPPLPVVTPSIVRRHILYRPPSYPPLSAVISSIVRRHILHCPWPHPPSFAVISPIVRDETLAFAATRWVFVAWRAQIERKYNPQGGSIPPTLLPGVASYRRQPRAIESTTPMGLRAAWPSIAKRQHKDSVQHGHLSSRHNMGCDHTIAWSRAPHAHPSPNHGIGMVSGNMECDHTIAWDCPTNSRGMRAKRRGRGYPEGVIPSRGQG